MLRVRGLSDGTDVTAKIRLVAMSPDENHVYRFVDEGREEEVTIEPGAPPKGRG